jgi:transcriptional regulator
MAHMKASEAALYEPIFHRNENLPELHALIRERVFGLLISNGAEGLIANSVPFILDPSASKLGTLQAHIARANGHWRELQTAPDALVVFQGADHYITPSWYATKQETGKVVPTWNYVMVQAKGRAKVVEDDVWLARQIEALTKTLESRREQPWAVGDAPADFVAMQRRAIVGIEIEIVDIRGKWKTSQNRSAADRAGVAAGLDALSDRESRAMAEVVREKSRD